MLVTRQVLNYNNKKVFLTLNFQEPKGAVQTGAKVFTKAAKVIKFWKIPLIDQMKEKIRKSNLILPHEKM